MVAVGGIHRNNNNDRQYQANDPTRQLLKQGGPVLGAGSISTLPGRTDSQFYRVADLGLGATRA
jgi:hypothetical protein